MSPAEIRDLVETLRACGVTHYKDGSLELDLGTAPAPIEKEDKEIVHKVQELTSLLKLGDKELVDRLFPDHTNYDDTGGAAEPTSTD